MHTMKLVHTQLRLKQIRRVCLAQARENNYFPEKRDLNVIMIILSLRQVSKLCAKQDKGFQEAPKPVKLTPRLHL